MFDRNYKNVWPIAATLFAAAVAYRGVFDAGFVFDDDGYVLKNTNLAGGLRWEGVRWALTSTYAANWHPLTWVSHLLDVSLFDLRPRGHHGTSLLLHLLNTFVLWSVLRKMTGAASRATVIAGLFALHPCHVESVAWVSERKDVLYALFFLLGLAAYRRYVARPSRARFLIVAFLFSLSLAAKPMAASLPFLLLLLDWWPLGRIRQEFWGSLRPLVREKLPLFLLAAASGAVTLFAQREGRAVMSLGEYSLPSRIAGAGVGYLHYLSRTIWPSRLAAYYPHPGRYPAWEILAAFVILAAITLFVLRTTQRRPWATTGWFWFLGALVPVIGLVQVGSQSTADRYTYLPLFGIFLIAVWGVADGLPAGRWRVPALAGLSSMLLAILAALTSSQVAHWKSQRTLFEHALAVTNENSLAHYNLGRVDESEGRLKEAVAHFREAVRISPAFYEAHLNLGNTLVKGGAEAGIASHRITVGLRPREPRAHVNLGAALARFGRYSEAIAEYREALRLDPALVEGHMNLGNALSSMGRSEEALPSYEEALRLAPGNHDVHFNHGLALEKLGRRSEAVARYRETLRLRPDHIPARGGLQRLGVYP